MKEKTITIKTNGASQKQYSTFIARVKYNETTMEILRRKLTIVSILV